MRLVSISGRSDGSLIAKVLDDDDEPHVVPLTTDSATVLRSLVAPNAALPAVDGLTTEEAGDLAALRKEYAQTVEKHYDTPNGRARDQLSLQERMQPLADKDRESRFVRQLRELADTPTPAADTNKPAG